MPTLGDVDLHLYGEGRHLRLWEKFGAQPRVIDGVDGTSFAVWAPHARRVSVIGTFNDWDGRAHPMRLMGSSGVFELFIPGVSVGSLYKFEIRAPGGATRRENQQETPRCPHPSQVWAFRPWRHAT